MRKSFITLAMVCITGSMAYAQDPAQHTERQDRNIFNHLDLSLTLGSTGIGFELASPIGNHVQLRTGFSAMPHFNHNMHFGIQNYDDDQGIIEARFDQLANLMKDLTGYEVDQEVKMIGQPTYYNFKLLADVFPFRDKRWHFTAGFYVGNSKIAKAFNATEEMASLLALGMYNRMYEYMKDERYYDEPIYGEVFLDPDVGDQLRESMMAYGSLGIHLGDYRNEYMKDEAGNILYDENGNPKKKPYMMKPNSEGMVKATMRANKFKPYIGFGFGTINKSKCKPFNISFDCGIMFWGGTPEIITHDGINLAKDVEHIGGKVGRYVNALKALKVFPVVDIKLSYSIF